ncbi:hypothetical protein BJ138DRAFT_1103593 [Hygrophoropsis aurantiaca]|uniref:Uncharacterized protein n=1 Tax=Hygrophoropsis aurantiaca TaxID=72124 RepID=A0ACB8A4F7_9AGAM|nr:hypothetical protein BJ138DRAFT_1103593 [Hygrophoropsis aurantiaca]
MLSIFAKQQEQSGKIREQSRAERDVENQGINENKITNWKLNAARTSPNEGLEEPTMFGFGGMNEPQMTMKYKQCPDGRHPFCDGKATTTENGYRQKAFEVQRENYLMMYSTHGPWKTDWRDSGWIEGGADGCQETGPMGEKRPGFMERKKAGSDGERVVYQAVGEDPILILTHEATNTVTHGVKDIVMHEDQEQKNEGDQEMPKNDGMRMT